jgi:cysteine desulfurase
MRIYLDNAASTPLCDEALEAMLPFLKDQFGNPSSIHQHGRVLRAAIEAARTEIATLMGAAPSEIVFTSGGTEADNCALKGIVTAYPVKALITAATEHHAVIHPLEEIACQTKLPLHRVPLTHEGTPDLNALEIILSKTPNALVSLMHANNETGALIDIAAVGELVKKYGGWFHSDTVQTVGQVPLAFNTLPIDSAAASAHKFYGPKGVGFLYRKENVQIPSLICGGGQERNQRAGTENVAGIVGMAAALKKAIHTIEYRKQYIQSLKDKLLKGIQDFCPNILVNGSANPERALQTVLNVAFPGNDTESLLVMQLDIYQISVSSGSACTSGSPKPSHVLTAMGYDAVRIANSIRFSFGSQNTPDEIDTVLAILRKIIPAPVAA